MWCQPISRQLVSGQLDLETAFIQLKAIECQGISLHQCSANAAATLSASFFSIMFGGMSTMPLVQEWQPICFSTCSLCRKNLSVFPIWQLLQVLLFLVWLHYLGRAILAYHPQLIWSLQVRSAICTGIALTNAVRDIMTNHINSRYEQDVWILAGYPFRGKHLCRPPYSWTNMTLTTFLLQALAESASYYHFF